MTVTKFVLQLHGQAPGFTRVCLSVNSTSVITFFISIRFRQHNNNNLNLQVLCKLEIPVISFILTIPPSNELMAEMLDKVEIQTFMCSYWLRHVA